MLHDTEVFPILITSSGKLAIRLRSGLRQMQSRQTGALLRRTACLGPRSRFLTQRTRSGRRGTQSRDHTTFSAFLCPAIREIQSITRRCFNAKDAKVGAEERGGGFSLRPLRKPSRPLRLRFPACVVAALPSRTCPLTLNFELRGRARITTACPSRSASRLTPARATAPCSAIRSDTPRRRPCRTRASRRWD